MQQRTTIYILAISTGPDHAAGYDPILADAITDFFSDWKEKTLGDSMSTYRYVYMYAVTICIGYHMYF